MCVKAIVMIDYFMTNEALLQYVGKQMQQMRINARLSQQQLAERAGVSRSTITQVENGKGMKLESIVAMLRVLNKLEILNNFETQALVSPLLIAKQEGKIFIVATDGMRLGIAERLAIAGVQVVCCEFP